MKTRTSKALLLGSESLLVQGLSGHNTMGSARLHILDYVHMLQCLHDLLNPGADAGKSWEQ